ncbi:MAG TPA: tRNA pseudouridine(38-40) synthase TruA, partial [Firmicutes bacterium]|nr:tRNA pseudouridine(38-40) synthase TruA [Bacillota bacterium]
MKNIKIVLSYDGALFKGWAAQPGKRTVESTVKNALVKILGEFHNFYAAGRTDAGVHAENQVISLKAPISVNFSETGFCKALNSVLPDDIRIKKTKFIDREFNARFDAVSRTYRYILKHNDMYSVFDRSYVSYFRESISIAKFKTAAEDILGVHNFRGFSASCSESKNFEREIFSFLCEGNDKELILTISGNGFLTHMIRLITGTLIQIAAGKMPDNQIKIILKSGERGLTGKKTSPNGLFLQRIE